MTCPSKVKYKMIVSLLLCLLVISYCQSSEQQTMKSQSQPALAHNIVPEGASIGDSLYTQNIQEFKTKKYNQRLQGLVGCWLMSKEYLDEYKSNYLFFKDLKLKEAVTLKLVKECLKKVTRKEAVVKITQLVGRNMEPAKRYEDVVAKSLVDGIFEQVSKLTIANYHHYKPINEDGIVGEPQANASAQGTEELHAPLEPMQQNTTEQTTLSSNQQNQSTNKVNPSSLLPEQIASHNSFTQMSEFDLFISDLLQKYNDEFQKLASSREGLKGRVEEQLKKREKYYFGLIPASNFTHSVMLVTISLSLVFCCTCFKYYRKRSAQIEQKKIKRNQQSDDNCGSHGHSHAKEIKKIDMGKMAKLTMKRKTK